MVAGDYTYINTNLDSLNPETKLNFLVLNLFSQKSELFCKIFTNISDKEFDKKVKVNWIELAFSIIIEGDKTKSKIECWFKATTTKITRWKFRNEASKSIDKDTSEY